MSRISRTYAGPEAPVSTPETDVATFFAVDIRAGVITRAEPFPEARQPAFRIWMQSP